MFTMLKYGTVNFHSVHYPDRRSIECSNGSEPSGLLPLKFRVVISEMRKHVWRWPGCVWFANCVPRKFIFLVRNVCRASYRDKIDINSHIVVKSAGVWSTVMIFVRWSLKLKTIQRMTRKISKNMELPNKNYKSLQFKSGNETSSIGKPCVEEF